MKYNRKLWTAFSLILLAGLMGFFVIGETGGSATVDLKTASIPFNAYAPEQPIPYSHKLHAGQLQIECEYCHTYARRSRSAGIPALEQCMACHLLIGGQYENIQKITAAYEAGEAIQWVKVHDIPDYVYFSHKRHVKAGFECQECHGPVEQMEVLYRHAPLTMGWCVNCHQDNLDKGANLDCLTCHK